MAGRRVGAAAMIVRCIVNGCLFAVAAVTASSARAECLRAIGAVPSLQGEAQVQAAGVWRQAALNEQLCPGDVIHVGERSRAEVTVVNQPNVRLDQNTALHLPGEDQPLVVKLLYGAAYFFSRDPRRLTVDTPFIDAAVEGTEFLVQVEAERTLIVVFEGRVRASNPHGELAIASGEAGSRRGRAGADPLPDRPAARRRAVDAVLSGDPAGAGRSLRCFGAGAAGAAARRGCSWRRKASCRRRSRNSRRSRRRNAAPTTISIGRRRCCRSAGSRRRGPTSARRRCGSRRRPRRRAERGDRGSPERPRAGAGRCPTGGRAEPPLGGRQDRPLLCRAGALPDRGGASGDEPSGRGRAGEPAGLGAALRAVADAGPARPGAAGGANGRASWRRSWRARRRCWASPSSPRSTPAGRRRRSGGRSPSTRRTRCPASAWAWPPSAPATWRGAARRSRSRWRSTRRTRCCAAISARPTSTSGPPTRSPTSRSWSTNFPNQENTLAAQQFAISKELDPNDPTPWLYDAIRLQSENRPVEALRNIEKSIELNDNRAVYRSRELLDQDRAARGASLARIYNDLGFEQLGINEATKSLSLDPSNAGAHRFLSDVYATQPRSEIARRQRTPAGAAPAGHQHQPGAAEPERDQPRHHHLRRPGPARVQRVHPAVRAQPGAAQHLWRSGSDWTRGRTRRSFPAFTTRFPSVPATSSIDRWVSEKF